MQVTKAHILDWLDAAAKVMQENKEYLTELDAAIGDADHGINMSRGFAKVQEKLPGMKDKDIGVILKETGMTLLSSVGGASGPLYGTFFMKAGMVLTGKEALDAPDVLELLEKGVEGILSRGRAVLEDKTMYDAWQPAVEAFGTAISGGAQTPAALDAALVAAEEGMKATIPLQARKGRASYLGERSVGYQDPGATSSYLLLKTLRESLNG